MATIDQSGHSVVFDPNERPSSWAADKAMALFPRVHEALSGFVHDIDTYVAAMAKAISPPPSAFAYAQISYMPDVANAGLMSWPGIPPDSLRKIARENIAPQLILQNRVLDVRRYAGRSSHPWKPGWRIELMDGGRHPTRAEMRDIRAAERYITNCNLETAYSDARTRDAEGHGRVTAFSDFLAVGMYDSLRVDGWAIWTDMVRDGRVKAFANLSAGNIRLAHPDFGYAGDKSKYAALLDETGTPAASFTRDEMTWRVRNPRSDPGILSYGYSELEQGVRLIQGFQSAIDLNVDTFTKSGIPNGILLLKGDFWTAKQIDFATREWQNLKKGQSKVWGLPVMGVPEKGDVDILPLNDLKGTDVRYKDHMNMMVGALCTLYGFPIRRLGYKVSGMERDNAPLPDQSTTEVGDDDPGLAPLLLFIEDTINPYILWPNWPHLRFVFSGKNPKEDAREVESQKLARTWQESRAQVDLPPLEQGVPAEFKPLMEIMAFCPEDPAKISAFQTLATTMLQAKLGVGDEKDSKSPGASMKPKKDAAESEAHGATAGVRRNSRAESKKD